MPASKDIPLTELTPALYRDLRRIASRHLSGERPNHTLQATALVHEAYLKLAKERTPCFSDEVHLLAVASRVMRQVLVDYARSRATQKRKGQANSLDLITTVQIKGEGGLELIEVLMLDDALVALAAEDEARPRHRNALLRRDDRRGVSGSARYFRSRCAPSTPLRAHLAEKKAARFITKLHRRADT